MPDTILDHRPREAWIAAAALQALRDALGRDRVLDGDAAEGHADPYSFRGIATVTPAAVAMPGSVAEVQEVLHIATAYAIPVWTVSAGRNYGYGGASPRLPGSLVVDLRRMNAVLSVDEACATALLEPGVTFMQFDAHLRAAGSRLMPSVADIGSGSVVGDALERGFGFTPHCDHSTMMCGLEVVLADGEVVRTGMGAKRGSPVWQNYKGGFGPSLEGLFLQSNLGIVTKMGLWLLPRPEVTAACAVAVPRFADLGALVDALRPLLQDETIGSNAVIGNAALLAARHSERAEFCATDAPIGLDGLAAIADRLGIGLWNARFGVHGPDAVVQAKLSVVRRAMAALPGASLTVRSYPANVPQDEVHPADRPQLGIPSMDGMQVARWRGGEPAATEFSLVCPPTGRDAMATMELIRTGMEAHGFDYAGGITLFPRHAIAQAMISFDRSDPVQAGRVARLFPALLLEAAMIGAAPYRTHTAFMDLVAAQYDTGGQALLRLVERLKDAMDPAGILSPGKQGVWPGRSTEALGGMA